MSNPNTAADIANIARLRRRAEWAHQQAMNMGNMICLLIEDPLTSPDDMHEFHAEQDNYAEEARQLQRVADQRMLDLLGDPWHADEDGRTFQQRRADLEEQVRTEMRRQELTDAGYDEIDRRNEELLHVQAEQAQQESDTDDGSADILNQDRSELAERLGTLIINTTPQWLSSTYGDCITTSIDTSSHVVESTDCTTINAQQLAWIIAGYLHGEQW